MDENVNIKELKEIIKFTCKISNKFYDERVIEFCQKETLLKSIKRYFLIVNSFPQYKNRKFIE